MVENSCADLQNNNCAQDTALESKHPAHHASLCMGCGQEIFDRYILRVAPDLEWHAACLKCTQCQQYLDESCTAFVRDGKTYCKNDYIRLFGAKCSKCNEHFNKNDCVMRARHQIFHLDCFRCVHCNKKLLPGDQFALRDDELFCKSDHDLKEKVSPLQLAPLDAMEDELVVGTLSSLGNGPMAMMVAPGLSLSGSQSALSPDQTVALEPRSKKDKKDKPKTTRVRTVLNEKQLHTLRTCYNANPRPDALMKEQLVEMTGLSPRVIRVWFQNKRCKDKKRQIAMKDMQRLHEKNQALNGVRMQGIGPLIAASPSSHEQVPMVQPIDVQQFSQNSALWTPLPPNEPVCSLESQTPFQQLMHGFGDPSSDPTMGSYMGSGSFHSEMDSFSPQMAPSDLSSPSCSE